MPLRPPGVVGGDLAVLAPLSAVAALLSGDSGARMVWEPIWRVVD